MRVFSCFGEFWLLGWYFGGAKISPLSSPPRRQLVMDIRPHCNGENGAWVAWRVYMAFTLFLSYLSP